MLFLKIFIVLLLLTPAYSMAESEDKASTILISASSDKEYSFLLIPENPVAQTMATNLNSEDFEKFQEKRKIFLSSAARVLNYGGLSYGVGAIVKEKIRQIFSFWKKNNPIEEAASQLPAPLTLRERSQLVITNVLHAIDHQLWTDAGLVIRAHEIGVSLSMTALTIHAVNRNGIGGGVGIGLSISYNYDQRAMVFEIPLLTEKFEQAYPTTFLLGLNLKAGFHMNDSQNKGSLSEKGMAFYPPLAPTNIESSPNNFSGGIATLIGLPPSPFSDMMSWRTTLSKFLIFRVSISPLYSGFVRFSAVAAEPIAQFLERFKDKLLPPRLRPLQAGGPLRCQALFSDGAGY